MCIRDSSTTYTLTGGSPSGGTYSGPGVTGTNFSASVAGVGTKTITYTYIDINGCSGSATNSIVINALPVVSFGGTLTAQCISSTTYTLTGGSPSGGTYSGPGVTGTNFNASVAGVGTKTITYTYSNGCTSSATNSIVVNALPVVSFGGTLTAQCDNSTTYTLTGGSPLGGTYSGPGVTGTNFNASVAGVGTHSINYTYTDVNGCFNSATNTIVVNPIPTPTLSSSAPGNVSCAGTNVTFTATGGISYNFWLGGVSVQTGTSATYTTNSLTNGEILYVIVTNASGCSAQSAQIQNIVNPLPIFTSTPPTCSPDLSTYSFTVTVFGPGTVSSTAGTVTNTGGGVWTITGILAGINTTFTVTSSCVSTQTVTAPNCSCPVVLPPVSGGDKSYCASGVVPTITATVLAGETVDWYNVSSGGTPLMSGSLSYTPSAAGSYYALARNTTTDCVSS